MDWEISKKQKELQNILKEYSTVVNIFINYFWNSKNKIDKTKLLKPIVDIPKNTWLSARLRKVAAREALDMINSVNSVFDWNKEQLQTSINQIKSKIEEIKNSLKGENTSKNNTHLKNCCVY